jgi:hypothetical protein
LFVLVLCVSSLVGFAGQESKQERYRRETEAWWTSALTTWKSQGKSAVTLQKISEPPVPTDLDDVLRGGSVLYSYSGYSVPELEGLETIQRLRARIALLGR